jgi:DNA-binding transcriptional LysR family regulator
MNLNHLSIFQAVAQAGSVSRGAERLMISQPAVSKQLLHLERSLRVRLLDRIPRGVRLTEAGRVLSEYAARLFAIESEAATALGELAGLRRGRLRLGASTTIGVYLLPEIFVRFRTDYPLIHASLEVIGSAAVAQRLVTGDLDLGFTEVLTASDQLETTIFRTDELVPIASPSHPLTRKRSVPARQFCAEPFVVRDTGSETKSFVERALAVKGLFVSAVMSLGSTEAIKRAVAAGVGVAIVSRLSIGLELETKRLAIVRVKGMSIRRPLYCVRPARSQQSPAILAFTKLLTEPQKKGPRIENRVIAQP